MFLFGLIGLIVLLGLLFLLVRFAIGEGHPSDLVLKVLEDASKSVVDLCKVGEKYGGIVLV